MMLLMFCVSWVRLLIWLLVVWVVEMVLWIILVVFLIWWLIFLMDVDNFLEVDVMVCILVEVCLDVVDVLVVLFDVLLVIVCNFFVVDCMWLLFLIMIFKSFLIFVWNLLIRFLMVCVCCLWVVWFLFCLCFRCFCFRVFFWKIFIVLVMFVILLLVDWIGILIFVLLWVSVFIILVKLLIWLERCVDINMVSILVLMVFSVVIVMI